MKNVSARKVFLSSLILLTILIGTGFLLYITYEMPGAKVRFFARNINDATYNCEDSIDDRYKKKLMHKSYDNLSSRYSADKHQYSIFYRISVQENKNKRTEIKDYMVKCIVWEKLGYVSEFTVFEI